jgi:hypothetical protein
MVVVADNAREDSQDGELGVDNHQLGKSAGGGDQPGVTVGRDITARRLTMCGNHGFALQLAYGIAC